MNEDIIVCPGCKSVLDKTTLYNMDCICMECGHFIDIDEMEWEEMWEGYERGDNYWDDYWDSYDSRDDYYIEMMKRRNASKNNRGSEDMLPALKDEDEKTNSIATFVIRFVTSADYNTVKESFETLEGNIDFMEMNTDGPIKAFLDKDSGKKLAKGLNLNPDDLDEYVVVASFILGDEDESKKILVSTLCDGFPLCIIREEESKYIMANNKGLAKGLIDTCNEDEIEILSLFLTGFEKYKVLSYFLYWCVPYKSSRADDIMIKWDNNSLISLKTLREVKEVPTIWQEYLASVTGVTVSKDDKDAGTWEEFESMLEDVVDELETKKEIDETENLIEVVSLRGLSDFSILSEEGVEVIDATTKK